MFLKPDLVPIIKAKAAEFSLDPVLVGAIIMQESGGDLWAVRFEPRWNIFLDPVRFAKMNRISELTEKNFQACSFGAMQVMGTVMRERGFKGNWGQAFDIDINLGCGCRHLNFFLSRHAGNELDAISAYNCGTPKKDALGKYSNQRYVDGVISWKEKVRGQF